MTYMTKTRLHTATRTAYQGGRIYEVKTVRFTWRKREALPGEDQYVPRIRPSVPVPFDRSEWDGTPTPGCDDCAFRVQAFGVRCPDHLGN